MIGDDVTEAHNWSSFEGLDEALLLLLLITSKYWTLHTHTQTAAAAPTKTAAAAVAPIVVTQVVVERLLEPGVVWWLRWHGTPSVDCGALSNDRPVRQCAGLAMGALPWWQCYQILNAVISRKNNETAIFGGFLEWGFFKCWSFCLFCDCVGALVNDSF